MSESILVQGNKLIQPLAISETYKVNFDLDVDGEAKLSVDCIHEGCFFNVKEVTGKDAVELYNLITRKGWKKIN